MPKRGIGWQTLVSPEEMNGKIRAALDARRSEETLIIAHSAVAVEGYDRAMERAEGCVDAGADVRFIEAVTDLIRSNRQLTVLGTVSRCSSTWSAEKRLIYLVTSADYSCRYFSRRAGTCSGTCCWQLFDLCEPWRNSALSCKCWLGS